eukprot:scaffold1381_cov64-Cylindrotheca_fusiformis.AAC.9
MKSPIIRLVILLLILVGHPYTVLAKDCFASRAELREAIEIFMQFITGQMSAEDFEIIGFGEKYGTSMSVWCTSGLTNFSSVFNPTSYQAEFGLETFNEDITSWDTSAATDMSYMFVGSSAFNQDISSWDTGNVVDFTGMFTDCESFNQDIGKWNVTSGERFSWMFSGAEIFNQDLNSWSAASSMKEIYGMFEDAKSFNGDISSWDISQVTDLSSVFAGASSFNSDITNWNVANVQNMARLFMKATSFNQDISKWNVGTTTTDMLHLFHGASTFNQDIGNWDVSSVTNMANMFHEASTFNQDLSNWDVSKVTKKAEMFMDATNFDQDLCQWKDIIQYEEMENMFAGTSCLFPQDPDPATKGPFCASYCAPFNNPTAPPTLPPTMPSPTPIQYTNPSSSYKPLEPISDETKAIIFGTLGALTLLVVVIATTLFGEEAGSKQFELELHDQPPSSSRAASAPAARLLPDPNALPIVDHSFVDVDNIRSEDISVSDYDDDHDDDSDDDDAPVIV